MPRHQKGADPTSDERKKSAETLRLAVEKAAAEFDADILLINSPMDGIDTSLIRLVCATRRRPNAILILVTEGGNPDVAYRIARCLQETYESFTVVVAGWCKSAGTLICIGADAIIMGDLGELGPLDIQLAKPDELGLISSGLTIDSAFRSLQSVAFQMFERFLLDTLQKSGGRITTKTAAELAATITVGTMSPIFQQMDPMKIGEDYRSTRIAEEYAVRLDAHAQNLVHDEDTEAIEILVRGYPSHGFVIDRTEAESLFQRVFVLEDVLNDVVSALGPTAIVPHTRKQPPAVQYLTKEASYEERSGAEDSAPAGEQPPGASNEGAGGERVSSDSTEGDGKVTVPVVDIQTRAPRHG
jgi:hypothetical protein